MLNLHATFTKGTGLNSDFFNSDAPSDGKQNGLHAGHVAKATFSFCLALSQMAKTLKSASPKPQQTENPKYAREHGF